MEDEISNIDKDISSTIKDLTKSHEETKKNISEINVGFDELVKRVSSINQKSEISESQVRTICTEIKSYDTIKNNLTLTISALKKFLTLADAIEKLRTFCIEFKYREAANLIEAINDLFTFFKDYLKNPQVLEIKSQKDLLCNQLRTQILEELERYLNLGLLPKIGISTMSRKAA